jgi:hypothetical protein
MKNIILAISILIITILAVTIAVVVSIQGILRHSAGVLEAGRANRTEWINRALECADKHGDEELKREIILDVYKESTR